MPKSNRRPRTTTRRDPLAKLEAGEGQLVIQSSTGPADDSSKLTKMDYEFYRAELRQHLHREMRRVFERCKRDDGLTYSELANRLGVHRSVITKRFKGHVNLTLDVLSDMFRAMGARPSIRAEMIRDLESQKLRLTWNYDDLRGVVKSVLETRGHFKEFDIRLASIDDWISPIRLVEREKEGQEKLTGHFVDWSLRDVVDKPESENLVFLYRPGHNVDVWSSSAPVFGSKDSNYLVGSRPKISGEYKPASEVEMAPSVAVISYNKRHMT